MVIHTVHSSVTLQCFTIEASAGSGPALTFDVLIKAEKGNILSDEIKGLLYGYSFILLVEG